MSRRSARASRGHQRTSRRRRRCEYRTSERPDRVGQNPLRVDTLEGHLESNECSPRRPPSVRESSLFARASMSTGSKGPALASGRITNREQCYNRLICPPSAIQGRFLKVGKSVRAAPILDLRLGRLWEERRASAGGLSNRLIFQTSLIVAPPS